MKVFATLATILGVAHASQDIRMGSIDMMRSDMGRQRMGLMADRQMALRMSPVRTMYRDQAMAPNQYFLQDKFGNYVYAYANQNSEKMEEGDQNSVKGHYAYIMSNGQKRRVDYIADNQGFHVIRDDAVDSRIKRSVQPDLIQTKMTSFMDSSSLRDDSQNMYRMMSPNNMMHRNRMMDNQQMSQNMGRNMYLMNDDMPSQMMGQDMSNNMMYKNMMEQDLSSNMMGQDMSNNMMYRNMMGQMSMMGQDLSNNVMNRRNQNMMGSQNMYSNMMGSQNMYSNMMGRGMNRMNSYANNKLMGQNRNMMSQRMEIEQIPSNRLF